MESLYESMREDLPEMSSGIDLVGSRVGFDWKKSDIIQVENGNILLLNEDLCRDKKRRTFAVDIEMLEGLREKSIPQEFVVEGIITPWRKLIQDIHYPQELRDWLEVKADGKEITKMIGGHVYRKFKGDNGGESIYL